jgi:hypothetical protein
MKIAKSLDEKHTKHRRKKCKIENIEDNDFSINTVGF